MSVNIIAELHPLRSGRTKLTVNSKSIADIIRELNAGFPLSQARVCRNGEIVKDFSIMAEDGDTLWIKFVPYGGGTQDTGSGMKAGGAALIFVGIVVTIATWGAGSPWGVILIGTGIGMLAGGMALMNINIPNIPSIKDREKPENDPSIRGGKNQARPHGRIPVLFGRHRLYPDLAANSHTQIIDGKQYYTQLFCGGYKDCAVDLTTFKLGETSLTDLSLTKNISRILAGVDPVISMEILQNGEESKLYPCCVHEDAVNAPLQNTIDGGGGSKIPGKFIRTTPDNTDAINVDIFFHNGLGQYENNGSLISTSVEVRAWYKLASEADSSYALLGYFNSGSNIISGAELKTKRYQVTKSGLTPGQYTVKIERVTADSTDSKVIDQVYTGSVRSIKSVRPIREERQRELTVIALRVLATSQMNGVLDSFNFVATAKMPVYSSSGSGAPSWLNAKETQNPASALLYALQGRAAQQLVDPDDIDWPSIEAFYTWCKAHKYMCNAYLFESVTIAELLRMIGNTARADILRIDSKISVVQDIERPSPMQLFTPKNTKNYSVTMFNADIPDAIDLRFIDEDAGYTQNEAQIYNTPDGNRITEAETIQKVDLWGITNSGQARRMGMYNYACLKNRPFVHTIEVDIEYLLCNKGDWIQYAGDLALTGSVQGRIAGLFFENGLCKGIRIDESIEDECKDYAVRLRLSDGTVVLKNIFYINKPNEIFFEQPFEKDSEPHVGDIYAFGIRGYEVIDLIITDIQPQADLSAVLTCVEYSPEIFNVDNPDFVLPDFVNKITPVSGAVDSGVIGISDLQTWLTYHDDEETPERPAGDGTENGWHHLITPHSKWMSRKTARHITEGEWSAPAKTTYQIINEAVSSRPTFKEIVQGFSVEGATQVPIRPELTASGGFRSINLSWMKQTNLSNLKEYEIQVSENAVNWYAPRFDGQGPIEAPWRGEEDKTFITAATFVVHSNIPPAGTADEPAGRLLYYRVRQRTVLGVLSDWSEIAGAQTKLTDTGDYGVNSISANALKVAEFWGIFAKLTESLIVDPRYGLSSENTEWADGDTRAILNSRQVAFQFFMDTIWVTMARLGLEGVEAAQIYSHDKMFITNADMLLRRSRGYDVGAPLPSDSSRVAHLDVNEEISITGSSASVLDQHGEIFFALAGTGSLEGESEGVPLFLKAVAPYATEARALHGNFRLLNTFSVSGAWTFDFWLFYFWNENQVIFSIGNNNEKLQLSVENNEPYLNDEPTDGVWLNDEAIDGVWLNEIKAAHSKLKHTFLTNTSEILLDQNKLEEGKWYHFGIIADGYTLKLLVNNGLQLSWDSQTQILPITVDINPTAGAIDGENSLLMVDELMFDPETALAVDIFHKNTNLKRPWGKLDDQYPWAIINVKDPQFFKTNIFKSPDFADAVREIINGG